MQVRTVAGRSPTLTGRLRGATAGVHQVRELRVGGGSGLEYRVYLARLYGAHVAIEGALSSARGLTSIIADAALRNHKAALLAHDLVALGVDRRDLFAVPRMPIAAPLALPEALGWTYVVESLVLGGKPLARRLVRHLAAEIHTASAYLSCYGDEAHGRWRQLGAALDACAFTEREGDRVIDAARDGFGRLHAWVQPAGQPRSTRIHA